MKKSFRGIRPDDIHGRMGLRNPERGFRNEIYFSEIPGELAGTCSCHIKQNKLDGRPTAPYYENAEIPGVPHLIRGNRLDAVEFSHGLWQDEVDYFAYDGLCVMQSYCFLLTYHERKLTQEKLDDIENFFLKLRRAKVKALLRFAYELVTYPTGATKERILEHLAQLAPLIRKYKDVIYVLQCGFIGRYGEFHSSFHNLDLDIKFHGELYEEVLKVLPSDRKTMVRYPQLKTNVYGLEALTENEAFSGISKARIGHFNDGFMAGETHGGTFYPRTGGPCPEDKEFWFSYLDQESRFVPMDGELFWRDLLGMALPTKTVLNLRRWHYDTLGFVHSHSAFEGANTTYSFDVWKRIPIDPMFIKQENLPMSDSYFENEHGKYVPRSYYEYIRDHLGYRIELQDADISLCGKTVTAKIRLINRGFSAPVNPRPVQLKLNGKHNSYTFVFDTDVRKWYAAEEQVLTLKAELDHLPEDSSFEAALALPDAGEAIADMPEFAIRCANDLEFKNGANVLGIVNCES